MVMELMSIDVRTASAEEGRASAVDKALTAAIPDPATFACISAAATIAEPLAICFFNCFT